MSPMSHSLPAYVEIKSVLQPDADVLAELEEQVLQGIAQPNLKVIVENIRSNDRHALLIDWPFANAEELTQLISQLLGWQTTNPMDPFFWMLWRGWAGKLDAAMVRSLDGLSEEVMAKIESGVPLRGEAYDQLLEALSWAYANVRCEWSQSASWKMGRLSPKHLAARRQLADYIHQRMVTLYSEQYREARL